MTKPIWPKIPARFVSSMLAGHSALGLAFAALMYVLCISGTLLVPTAELARWENPTVPITTDMPPATIARMLETGVQIAAEQGINDYIVATPPAADAPYASLRIMDFTTGAETIYNVDGEGTLLGERREGALHFLEHLHINLHMPQMIGLTLVGLAGVALLASVVSGTLSHPRIFRDAFTFRRGGSRRLQEADLHNRLSVWALPFHIVVPFTGALLGLSAIILGTLAMAAFDGDMSRARATIGGPVFAEDPAPAPLPQIVPAIETALAKHPEARLQRVAVYNAGEKGQSFLVALHMPRDLTLSEQYFYDGEGNLAGSRGFADGPAGAQLIAALGPLHFGWFGGWPVKIAYVLLGLGLTAIISTGVTIWIARRKDKGKPVPGWERAWYALVWGQPISYCAIALTSLFGLHFPEIPFYLGACLLAFVPAFLVPAPLAASRYLRIVLGLMLIALPVLHTLRYAPEGITDPAAWIVNASLLLSAVLVLGSIRLPWPTRKFAEHATAIDSR